MQSIQFDLRRFSTLIAIVMLIVLRPYVAYASDHLDTPTVIADPSADIGDIFAWPSSNGRRLNLVMNIVAHRFSDRLQYVFHVDSGNRFGKTTASTFIVCRFDAANTAECWVGNSDYVRGDASNPSGLEGNNRRFRVFAGLRDDPFFNNVKGTRAALGVAAAALSRTTMNEAGCPAFDESTSQAMFDQWRHTDGGPATNFLAGWQSSSLVISVDLDVVATGGKLLAVWGTVHKSSPGKPSRPQGTLDKNPSIPTLGEQIERTARPLTKNALIKLLRPDAESDARKERYNRVARTGWAQFSADIRRSLGLYDGFDGKCGNQWLADPKATSPTRYQVLAKVLADDRLWINSKSTVCTQFLAVELDDFGASGSSSGDCGGRTPNYDASNVFRSLLVNGTTKGVDDGLTRDDQVHSTTEFPFLAAPGANATSVTNGPRVTTSVAIDVSRLLPSNSTTSAAGVIDASSVTTSGAIAIANLDHQIAQLGDEAGVEELLLVRSRFLADYEALDRASVITEQGLATSTDLLRRARTRSAVHRFADALADITTAEHLGANKDQIATLRASILIATGRASEVVPQLEADMIRHPGFASRSALANAYAAIGRFADADRFYIAALADLDTTLPFPYAWIYFARGLMWSEQAGDPVRGEALYAQALTYLPEFAAATIHLAELEVARGDLASAIARLEHLVASTTEPEALALLGELHVRCGDPLRGRREISLAGQRFESLLARHPLAFADHAAEFYLRAGADAECAWALAQQNLANRETNRAVALAIKAAQATGRHREAEALVARARAQSSQAAPRAYPGLK